MKNNIEIALKLLKEEMKDEDYRRSWQANIAMAFYDQYFWNEQEYKNHNDIHDIANKAADNFLNLLFKSAENDEYKKNQLPKPRDSFYESLVHQELQMWVDKGKVTKRDFNFIIDRRGFNDDEIKLLKCGLVINNLEIIDE